MVRSLTPLVAPLPRCPQLYYSNVNLFSKQAQCDATLRTLQKLLNAEVGSGAPPLAAVVVDTFLVRRHDLNVTAPSRGFVFGAVSFARGGDASLQHAHNEPLSISSEMAFDAGVQPRLQSNRPTYVVVLEKETVFSRLVNDHFVDDVRQCGAEAILVTGKGFPSLTTRALVHKLSLIRPHVRVVAFADYNPAGCSIVLQYKLGSTSTSRHPEASSYAVPALGWVGLRGKHIRSLGNNINKGSVKPFTSAHDVKCRGLMELPFVRESDAFTAEVQCMAQRRECVELEGEGTSGCAA